MNTRDTETKEEMKCLIENGEFKSAKRSCERLLQQTLKSKGKHHSDTMELRYMLGRVFLGLGQPKKAIPCFEAAITGYKRVGVQGDVQRSSCLVNLFIAKQALGNGDVNTWASLLQAGNIRKDLFVPDDPAIAELLHIVSMQNTDEVEEANERPAATRAIIVAQHMYGTGYLSCLAIEGLLTSYAGGLDKTAQNKDAGELRVSPDGNVAVWLGEWLVEQYSVIFGAYNQRLLEPLDQLAKLYESRDRIAEAVAALQREKAINEQLALFTNEDIHAYLESLGRLYDRGKDWPNLIDVLKKQLAIEENDDVNDNAYKIAELADHLGTAHLKTEDYATAIKWHERAATFRPDDEGIEGHEAVTYRYNLGIAYEAHGDKGNPVSYRKALKVYRDTLRLGRAWLGIKDELVADILGTMGNLLIKLDKYAEASKCHRQAVQIWKSERGPSDPMVADSMNDLAVVCFCTGKYREARQLLRKALPIVEASYGVAHEKIVPVLNNAAVACAGCEDYSRAIKYLARTVQIVENSEGAWSEALTTYLANLGKVCVMAKRQKDATLAFDRAVVIAREKLGTDNPETKSLQANLDDLQAGKLSVTASDLWHMLSYTLL